MGKRFIDIVESQFFLLLPVVVMDCLQTGDITQEGRSGQATEDDHRMPAFEFFPKSEAAPLGVKHTDIGNEAACLGHVLSSSAAAFRILSCCNSLKNKSNQQQN